jgi:NAD(P)-dependent dehydrogenase (short-subunit alcohol dehydrogenase family)
MSEVLVVVGIGGMGEAIARRLGSGREVLLADFNQAAIERVSTTLTGDGYKVTGHQVDVSSHASVTELAQAAAALGEVRILAHTAGLSPVQASPQAILSVDLAGAAFVVEEFGKVIAPGGAGLVIASMAGAMAIGQLPGEAEVALAETPSDELLSLPFIVNGPASQDPNAAYVFAKRANQLRIQAAAHSWGARGARINTISPGIISTPMALRELDGEGGEYQRGLINGSALQRLGTAGDIASAAAFLLGPDAAFVTGTDLLVDGGTIAAIRSGLIALPQL